MTNNKMQYLSFLFACGITFSGCWGGLDGEELQQKRCSELFELVSSEMHLEFVAKDWRKSDLEVGILEISNFEVVAPTSDRLLERRALVVKNLTEAEALAGVSLTGVELSGGSLTDVNVVFFSGVEGICGVGPCKFTPGNVGYSRSQLLSPVGNYNTNYMIDGIFENSIPPNLIHGQHRMSFPAEVVRFPQKLDDAISVDGFISSSNAGLTNRTVCLIWLNHDLETTDLLIKDCLLWSLIGHVKSNYADKKPLGGVALVLSNFTDASDFDIGTLLKLGVNSSSCFNGVQNG